MDILRIAKRLFLWILLCHFNNFPISNGQSGCNPVGVGINIKKKIGTQAYIYNYYGAVGTYTSNKGYIITVVKHGNRLIWQSKNLSDIAYHVRVEGLGSSKKSVTIFHSNGEKTKFIKRGGFCGLFMVWEKEEIRPIYNAEDKNDLDNITDEQESGSVFKRVRLLNEEVV